MASSPPGFPVIGAVASIAGALASLLGFSYLLDLDATAVNVVTVLALGLCIDYGLLMVSRFREELRAMLQGAPVSELTREQVVEATATSMNRAGRTVVFSALTVAISLAGLMVLEIPFIRAISAAGVSVVLVALAVALTLIPALCALGARRLLRRGTEVAGDTGVFSRLAEVGAPDAVGRHHRRRRPARRARRAGPADGADLVGPRAAAQGHAGAHLLRGLPRGLPPARRRRGAAS